MSLNRIIATVSASLLLSVSPSLYAAADDSATAEYPETCPAIFHQTMKQLHSSKMLNLCEVTDGHPVLLVNTASHCGFTGQFGDLEKIHEKYAKDGLVVIGVSSDSFDQEAESESEAADVCFKNFGVTFTMLSTVPVKGDDAHPLFKEVARQDKAPKWNFYKYLINPQGEIVSSNSSFGMPDDKELQNLLATTAE